IKDAARRNRVTVLEYAQTDAAAGNLAIQGGHLTNGARCSSARPDDLCFIMRSSGTTGQPKVIPISHANMLARVRKTLRLLPLTPDDRCLNLAPLCYAHGLHIGVVMPFAAGGAVICPPAFNRETFLSCLHEPSPTWYTGGFTYHQAILNWFEQQPQALAGHRLRFMRSGAGPLSDRVRAGLEKLFDAPMLEFYNTT